MRFLKNWRVFLKGFWLFLVFLGLWGLISFLFLWRGLTLVKETPSKVLDHAFLTENTSSWAFLAPYPPFSWSRQGRTAVLGLLKTKNNLQGLEIDLLKGVSEEMLLFLTQEARRGLKNTAILARLGQKVPERALPEVLRPLREDFLTLWQFAEPHWPLAIDFLDLLEEHRQKKARITVLLMNENERRPMGGFAGSFFTLDFTNEGLKVDFSDVYGLDRLVPDTAKRPAPPYFHHLSPEISLRDVNLVPDFPRAAAEVRHFWQSAGKRPPETVIALNMRIIREMLTLTGPIYLAGYGVTLDAENFDVVLSALVETKAAGRFSAKEPVLLFAEALFEKKKWEKIPLHAVLGLPFEEIIAERSVMAHSQLEKTQKTIKKMGIQGEIDFLSKDKTKKDLEIDDMLHLEMVNVGANKTDRFLWTNVASVATVHQKGFITRDLTIKMTHSLRPNELDNLLGLRFWPENLRRLITEKMRWVLGEGENRTVLRIWVPKRAELLQTESNQPINQVWDYDRDYRVYEVLVNTRPGPTSLTKITYRVPLTRGSHAWRPYTLYAHPTNALSRASWTHETRFAPAGATVLEKSDNHGLSGPLWGDIYRSVATFGEDL